VRAAVLGSGLMGSTIAWDLGRSREVDEVVVADLDPERLKSAKRRGGRKVATEVVDVADGEKLRRFSKGFDVVASALPHGIVHPADVALVKSGAKVVNIAFEDEQMQLDVAAKKTGALLIPGCGLAPGLGGILLARGAERVGGADRGRILVGGLPQRPVEPFQYRLVFSVIGLLREFTDPARIIRNGRLTRVDPVSRTVRVDFPKPVGRCEAFYSDGLATLLYSMKGFKTLEELTVRFPGHVKKIKLLLDSGVLSKEPISVDGRDVRPFDVSAPALARKMSEGPPEDVTVMRVEVSGPSGRITFEMMDFYDQANGVTSMGKTTGYTCSIVSQMVGSGSVRGKGVVPPEVALKGKQSDLLVSELRRKGVRITENRG